MNKAKEIKEPVVHSILLPFLLDSYPDLLHDVEVKPCDNFPSGTIIKNCLKTKYLMTAKYPKAEYTSIGKYCNSWNTPLPGAWDDAQIMMADAFRFMDDSPTLALDDAIGWLDKQTSPGYPWSLKHQTKAPIVNTPWFIPWYKSWEESVLEGTAEPFIWRCFIKDEVKKAEDVRKDNPRSILASPVHATILGYRLFGVMNDRLTTEGTEFRAPCFVGVSKFNKMWDRLARHILFFPNRMHGDARRWDGSLMPPSLDVMKKFRMACSRNPKMLKAFEYFYDNVLNSVIVGIMGDLFQKNMGQPSGQVNTLHDNTMVHVLYWFYHWCLVVCKDIRFQPTWLSFKSHVNLVVMGDDVICSWSNEVHEYMLPTLVAKTFRSIGADLKFNTDNDDENQSISQLEFCSMHFHEYQGVYVPLMKREKMIASMFLKKQEDHPRIILRRLLSIRIEIWFDKYLLNMVESAIEFILSRYASQLSGPPTNIGGDDASLELILTLRWSKFTIEKHYMKPIV